jgi:hypothetical protein
MVLWTGSTETVPGSTMSRIDRCRWIKTRRPDLYDTEGVRPLLILATQDRMDSQHEVVALGGGQCVARGGAMGGSPEWSLKLAPMVLFPRGLAVHGLQSMGFLPRAPEGGSGW